MMKHGKCMDPFCDRLILMSVLNGLVFAKRLRLIKGDVFGSGLLPRKPVFQKYFLLLLTIMRHRCSLEDFFSLFRFLFVNHEFIEVKMVF